MLILRAGIHTCFHNGILCPAVCATRLPWRASRRRIVSGEGNQFGGQDQFEVRWFGGQDRFVEFVEFVEFVGRSQFGVRSAKCGGQDRFVEFLEFMEFVERNGFGVGK